MKILAVGAHYDDIELSAGGTIAKFIKQGHQILVIIISSSDYISYDNIILRTKEEARKEGIQGLITLGIKKDMIINLNYSTKNIPFDSEIIENINARIDKFKPNLIITHHPYAESHQDHINTSKSVMSASRKYNSIWVFEPLYPSKLSTFPFKPQKYVDISHTLSIKINAIKKHITQFKKYPYWKDLICCLARVRGIEINTQYAESFEIIKDSL